MPDHMPTFDELMNPVLKALSELGGSGSINEINEKVLELEEFSEELSAIYQNPEKSNQTQIAYRLAWARTYLKKFGFLENSGRGIWSLTKVANQEKRVSPKKVMKAIRDARKKEAKEKSQVTSAGYPETNGERFDEETWQDDLHHLLTNEIDPDAFERLAQRLLRESGFVQVEVTVRSGDGGIDGKGIAKMHGFMSFHVIFQCKRYKGSVSAGAIRDFRGAMVGRADKGLFITTGTFTPAAQKEATRDGAPPIDLVDGAELAEKLKELQLGIRTELIERVIVDKEWFTSL